MIVCVVCVCVQLIDGAFVWRTESVTHTLHYNHEYSSRKRSPPIFEVTDESPRIKKATKRNITNDICDLLFIRDGIIIILCDTDESQSRVELSMVAGSLLIFDRLGAKLFLIDMAINQCCSLMNIDSIINIFVMWLQRYVLLIQ